MQRFCLVIEAVNEKFRITANYCCSKMRRGSCILEEGQAQMMTLQLLALISTEVPRNAHEGNGC